MIHRGVRTVGTGVHLGGGGRVFGDHIGGHGKRRSGTQLFMLMAFASNVCGQEASSETLGNCLFLDIVLIFGKTINWICKGDFNSKISACRQKFGANCWGF